jgi:hypothetical protein
MNDGARTARLDIRQLRTQNLEAPMDRPLTIVVGGYIVAYPLGGMTWHHLNYLLGLHEMGHEVWFLEDSGEYSVPYNPAKWACEPDPTYGIEYLRRTFSDFGLPARWCYYSQFWDTHYGLSKAELDDLLRRADLLLCVSGVTPMRDSRPRPRRTCVIDTDPVFTQLQMQSRADLLDYYRRFDAVATFGRLVGTPACPLPTHGLRWIGTNQPVALRHWPVVPGSSRRFTTVGKWEHQHRDVEFAGRRYLSSKAPEWMKLVGLPSRTAWTLDLAMQSMPGDLAAQFRAAGWTISDPEAATVSCRTFGDFVRKSAGELTVAKQIYARVPSGWFSDRSSVYLASGRPAVVQSTGFEGWLPAGEGLFSFATIDDAAAALNAIDRDYARHSAAARRLAEKYLDAKKVLGELLEQVL